MIDLEVVASSIVIKKGLFSLHLTELLWGSGCHIPSISEGAIALSVEPQGNSPDDK